MVDRTKGKQLRGKGGKGSKKTHIIRQRIRRRQRQLKADRSLYLAAAATVALVWLIANANATTATAVNDFSKRAARRRPGTHSARFAILGSPTEPATGRVR